MPTATLAATDLGVHELAIAAATVQTFVITPTGVLQGQTPRVRLFNMGTALLYVRGGTTVTVGDPGASVLPPGSVTDFTPSTGTFSVISAAAAVVSVERQPQTDLLRLGGGSSSGGGSSTPTLPADVQSTGTLGALNAALAISPGPRDTMVAAVGGTFAGTITLQGSLDGVTWYTMNGAAQWLNVSTGALAATITAGGLWQTTISAIPFVRVVMTAYTSGSATIVLDATDGNASFALDGPLPAGNNVIGSVNIASGATGAQATAETGSLAALNAVAGGVSDLATMGQVQVQVTGTFSATLSFQVSNDGTNWVSKGLMSAPGGGMSTLLGAPGLYAGHIGARYFRVIATAYTSGTAVVTIRYNAAASGVQPTTLSAQLRALATADSQTGGVVDEVALGAWSSAAVDRLRTATGAGATPGTAGYFHLAVATGVQPTPSLSAVAAVTSGTPLDNTTARPSHTLQVDITTTAVGTAGAHSIVLEGSLDGTYYTPLATVAPASTSLTATDPTNHAAASVTGAPWRYVRARWAAIPTGWTGTLTARVASA